MFSLLKILFLVSLLFVALLNSIPTYLLTLSFQYYYVLYNMLNNVCRINQIHVIQLDIVWLLKSRCNNLWENTREKATVLVPPKFVDT